MAADNSFSLMMSKFSIVAVFFFQRCVIILIEILYDYYERIMYFGIIHF